VTRSEPPARFSSLTSLRVGGPIERLHSARDRGDLVDALSDYVARDTDDRLLVLGRGTNVVMSDEGFPGPVVVTAEGEIGVERHGDGCVFVADAGVEWDDLVTRTLEEGCAGIEMMSGVPGSVGAAPIQNIAAYGQQVGDVIDAVEVFDLASGETRWIERDECGFSFRSSRFKREWRGELVVVRVRFRLPTRDAAGVEPSTYVDIERYFERTGSSPTDLHERRLAVLAARRSKSMLCDPDDPLSRSVGSFFVNPRVPADLAETMEREFNVRGMRVHYLESAFDRTDGKRRVPGAHVLRYSGFRPGDRWGPVQLSDKHVLAIVARDGATATDVWRVASFIREQVRRATDVELQFEAQFIGDFPDPAVDAVPFDYPFVAGSEHEPAWVKSYRVAT
jgi:UDP-N-acetylmuramate dehydrogenase